MVDITTYMFGANEQKGDNACVSSSVSSTTLKLLAPRGAYDGVNDKVTITDADFVAGNIKNSVNIFGVTGTYTGGGGTKIGYLKTGQTTVYLTGDNGTYTDGDDQSYTDNSDNTITDNVTGLIWIKEVPKIIPDGSGSSTPSAQGYWHDNHGTYNVNNIISVNFPTFTIGTTYAVGDIVGYNSYNGFSYYRCKLAYTAAYGAPITDSNYSTYWTAYPDWQSGHAYNTGDIVNAAGTNGDGNYYTCTQNHTSSANDQPTSGQDWQSYWSASSGPSFYPYQSYSVGDIIYGSNAKMFHCILAYSPFDAAAIPQKSNTWQTYWDTWDTGLPTWNEFDTYTVGTFVLASSYSPDIYYCIQEASGWSQQPGSAPDYWISAPNFFICNTQHTAGSSYKPWNASYWTVDPWTGSAANLTTNITHPWAEWIYWINNLSYNSVQYKMPHINEYHSLARYNGTAPFINTTYFPNTANSYYHSSTTYAPSTGYDYIFYFTQATITLNTKATAYYCRPVVIPVLPE